MIPQPCCTHRLQRYERYGPLTIAALVATVLLAACSTEPVTAPSTRAARATIVSQQAVQDIPVIGRFAVNVTANGSLSPGVPIRLAFTASGVLDTKVVEFSVDAPEIQMTVPTQSPESFRVPGNVKIQSLASWQQSITAGRTITRELTVIAPVPGYYRIVASGFTRSAEPRMVDGQFVQDMDRREIWLLIDSAGGHVTDTFDETLVPSEFLKQPGPFRRPRTQAQRSPTSNVSASAMLDQTCQSINVVCGNVVYYDDSLHAYEPVPLTYITGQYVESESQS